MTWVFAALVVAVLGAVAAAAAGRFGAMPEAYADSPDVLPPDAQSRPLVADDLRRVRFPLAVRGYRMADVDALLDRLAGELEERRPESGREAGPEAGSGDGV